MSSPHPPAEEPSEADRDLLRRIVTPPSATPHVTEAAYKLIAAYRAKCVAEAVAERRSERIAEYDAQVEEREHAIEVEADLRTKLDDLKAELSSRDALIVQMRHMIRKHRGFMTDKILGDMLYLVPESLAGMVLVDAGAELRPYMNDNKAAEWDVLRAKLTACEKELISWEQADPDEAELRANLATLRAELSLAKAKISELEKAK